ncbi:MAG TPA: hypothetical protein PLQ42_06295 [Candidatus Hydrogenedentes bacterium]|nr:MAG: hypothetical protein BWY07_02122 [Candidatus Hydrogenedentes bacterium ADurb.Bin170]HNZ49514.1 hypothetical protein [Candidatus Hydrogenedentota bacterium]HOD95247.1 hypothetical protein [Candidatus Hydrogenedentota bacterium]HOR50675.1 hypothetical protein [Candidatus Hydrogenedentota bacterium]HPK24543.1 hypothetical protein [Candidatus Hydrogenedentota bacterium]
MKKCSRFGYIFVETVVAMGLLSLSAFVIQNALRQAMITRAQAQDITSARFLLEKISGERILLFQQPEGNGSGQCDPPFEKFRYEWSLERVDIPKPELPPGLSPEERDVLEDAYIDFMGKLTVRILWQRGGADFEAVGESLVGSSILWTPEDTQ